MKTLLANIKLYLKKRYCRHLSRTWMFIKEDKAINFFDVKCDLCGEILYKNVSQLDHEKIMKNHF